MFGCYVFNNFYTLNLSPGGRYGFLPLKLLCQFIFYLFHPISFWIYKRIWVCNFQNDKLEFAGNVIHYYSCAHAYVPYRRDSASPRNPCQSQSKIRNDTYQAQQQISRKFHGSAVKVPLQLTDKLIESTVDLICVHLSQLWPMDIISFSPDLGMTSNLRNTFIPESLPKCSKFLIKPHLYYFM